VVTFAVLVRASHFDGWIGGRRQDEG
jgi:hypothetical protein